MTVNRRQAKAPEKTGAVQGAGKTGAIPRISYRRKQRERRGGTFCGGKEQETTEETEGKEQPTEINHRWTPMDTDGEERIESHANTG